MKEISANELQNKIRNGDNIMLIDVREVYEHEEFSIGGINIPVAEIAVNVNRLKDLGEVDLVLYCRSGNRSSMAQKILAVQFDMHNTINLKGGMNAWKEM